MGGTRGAEPVAITKRRADTRAAPATSSRGPVKRPRSRSTVTPMPSKRSTESWGAMPAITPWTWSCTALKSTSGACARRPSAPAWRWATAALALASRALDGTQPVFRQSPPIVPGSISTVRAPSSAAPAATERPAEPAPRMQMSVSMVVAKWGAPSPMTLCGRRPAWCLRPLNLGLMY